MLLRLITIAGLMLASVASAAPAEDKPASGLFHKYGRRFDDVGEVDRKENFRTIKNWAEMAIDGRAEQTRSEGTSVLTSIVEHYEQNTHGLSKQDFADLEAAALTMLESKDQRVQIGGARVLRIAAPDKCPKAFLPVLKHRDPGVREKILDCFEDVADESCIPALVATAKRDSYCGIQAIRVLGSIESPKAKNELEAMLKVKNIPEHYREAIAKALDNIDLKFKQKKEPEKALLVN